MDDGDGNLVPVSRVELAGWVGLEWALTLIATAVLGALGAGLLPLPSSPGHREIGLILTTGACVVILAPIAVVVTRGVVHTLLVKMFGTTGMATVVRHLRRYHSDDGPEIDTYLVTVPDHRDRIWHVPVEVTVADENPHRPGHDLWVCYLKALPTRIWEASSQFVNSGPTSTVVVAGTAALTAGFAWKLVGACLG
jgi:hypothetical protein